MNETFKFEQRKREPEGRRDFQGEYMPEMVTLDELRERMRHVAGKE